jgi:hypothetical protein
MSQDKDPNQGEGDRTSARRYDRKTREYVAEGKVPDAASEAKAYVERDPDGASRAERRARRGPHDRTVDELVAKGHTVIDRVRRAVAGLRARLGRDREEK